MGSKAGCTVITQLSTFKTKKMIKVPSAIQLVFHSQCLFFWKKTECSFLKQKASWKAMRTLAVLQQIKFHHPIQVYLCNNSKVSATTDISVSHFISFCSANAQHRNNTQLLSKIIWLLSLTSGGLQTLHNQTAALVTLFAFPADFLFLNE